MKLTFFLSIFLAISANAQDIMKTKLTWKVGQLTDLNTNKNQVYQCTFITNGNQPIEWVQKNNYVRTLTITKTSGTWTNVKNQGKIVFDVVEDGEIGTVTIERSTVGLSIKMEKDQAQLPKLNQRFLVNSVN